MYLKKLGVVAPNKPIRSEITKDKKFAGAYVQDPQKGKHNWVYDLDITSMYPSIIMSLNISPEMKIGKVIGWNPEEFIKGKIFLLIEPISISSILAVPATVLNPSGARKIKSPPIS